MAPRIHQDIKPDNILLSKPPPEKKSLVAKGKAVLGRGRNLISTGRMKSSYDFVPVLADFGHSDMRVVRRQETDELGKDRHGNQLYGKLISRGLSGVEELERYLWCRAPERRASESWLTMLTTATRGSRMQPPCRLSPRRPQPHHL